MKPIKNVAVSCGLVAAALLAPSGALLAADAGADASADPGTSASEFDRSGPWTAPVANTPGKTFTPQPQPLPQPIPSPGSTTIVRPRPVATRTAQAQAQPRPAARAPARPARKPVQRAPAAFDPNGVVGASTLAEDFASQTSRDQARPLNAPMPSGPLSLNNAVLLAVSRHPTVTAQIASIAQATGGIDVAKAGYFPQIVMNTGTGTSSLTGMGNTIGMQITQMLYDFGKVSTQVDQAQSTVQRERANLLQQLSVVEQKTAETFINAHRYQEQQNIAAEEVDATQQIYEMAKLRANSGVSTRSDPIQAETRVQSAQATLIQVKALSDEMTQHLRTLVGGNIKDGVSEPLSDDRVKAIRLVEAPSTNLMPNVLVAQAQELIAHAQLNNAKAQMYPTLNVQYADTKNVTGRNQITNSVAGNNHSIGLGIQWTAYQGGALAGQVNAAKYALESARQNVAAQRLNGSDAARGYMEQAIGARNRLGKLGERKTSIAQTRDLYREQYKLGTRSILDLLNSEQEYYQAALDEETAKHDYWIALVDYIGALGTGNTFYGIASRTIQGVKVQ